MPPRPPRSLRARAPRTRPRNGAATIAASAAACLAFAAAPRAASAQEKAALQLFHFNLQYVAGGMVGYTLLPNPAIDLDAEAIEDLIITESLEPVVALFEAHPTWGVDIELQGYFIDVLAARHASLLDRMRVLAKAGRMDIASFHYSDQFFIAYPEEDWERSQALTAATFAAHDIPLSTTVFCQEGQAGLGLAPRLVERGYHTFVWPKNLWSFQHGSVTAQALYAFGGARALAGGLGVDDAANGIQVTWTFLDDGELLATGDLNPYFPEIFRHDAAAVAAYESTLAGLEAQGYAISTVSRYVSAVEALPGVTPAPMPDMLDGTWQPGSTESAQRWLGGSGLWFAQERDDDVRTLGALAHRELTAAETIATEAGLADARERLDGAWRLLALGQVSDATGINPFRGEVEYGLAHLSEALRVAREVIDDGKARLGLAAARIDPAASSVSADDGTPILRGTPASAAPLDLAVTAADRTYRESWEELAPGHARVELVFDGGEGRNLSVVFPGALEDAFVLTRALADGQAASFSRAAFAFDIMWQPLPLGLVSLGGGRFVIKDEGRVHLAAGIRRDSGDITFADETAPPGEPQTWVFHVFDGTSTEAVALARALNGARTVAR